MKKKTTWLFLLLAGLCVFGSAQAGEMEPPGPPAPTMVTLQQIFDDLKPSPPDECFNNTGRFVDCGDGTVKDNLTGLFWLKDAGCSSWPTNKGPQDSWAQASKAVARLADGWCGLTDGSKPGDWRLPTLMCPSGPNCTIAEATGEFASIFASSCSPHFIPDTVGTGCWSEGDPFLGVQSLYWSSTTVTSNPTLTWITPWLYGVVMSGAKNSTAFHRWPVRGGP